MHTAKPSNEDKQQPYRGLYQRLNGTLVPYHQEPLRVDAPGHRPPHAHVDTEAIVIINIHLKDFPDEGSPAKQMHTVLDPYYRSTRPGKLVYIDAMYSFDTTDDATEYRNTLSMRLKVLSKLPRARIIVFIHTHSEESTGDLFWKKGVSSDNLEEVMPDRLIQAGANHEVTLAMLACGSLVQSATQRKALKTLAERMQAERVIAWGAAAVQACYTGSFFISFATTVLIERMPLSHAIVARLLDSSTLLARHTSMLLWTRRSSTDKDLHANEYIWSHPRIQPWGNKLPMQCPDCRAIYTFKVKSVHDAETKAFCT
ncbi:hypothetical protein L227DRAFT_568855, partial [Lentinus tigrinus ALCF2SS1-6]